MSLEFQNWLKTGENCCTPIEFFKSDDKPCLSLKISSNGVYGVQSVYEFMGIVNDNILDSTMYGQLYNIYEKFSSWQKELICNVWKKGIEKKMNLQSVMKDESCMSEIGYERIR